MKVAIFAGGVGSRLSEYTDKIPKPMVEVGGKPIVQHIMNIYSHYGYDDFIICCGYKANVIKEYFKNFHIYNSDFKIRLNNHHDDGIVNYYDEFDKQEVTLVDTGLNSNTAKRLYNIKKYLKGEEIFLLTYGDGVCDVDINKLIEFHKSQNSIVTLTAVNNISRFGVLDIEDNCVLSFKEKLIDHTHYINGGFFVVDKKIFNYISEDSNLMFEDVLKQLAMEKKLSAYTHEGFWQCVDTARDLNILEELWNSGKAPWKVW